MELTNLQTVNISLESFCAVVCAVIAVSSLKRGNRYKSNSSKWYGYSCIVNTIMSLADIVCWLSEGSVPKWKLYSLPIAEFIFWLGGIVIFITYFRYMHAYIGETVKISNVFNYFAEAVAAVYIAILISTPFTGWYYKILPGNIYQRGKLYLLSVVFEAVYYIETIYLIVRYRKAIKLRNACILGLFIVIPALFQAVQICFYGIALNTTGITISFLIIFTNLNRRLAENLEERNSQIISIQKRTIVSLSNLVENRDTDTGEHVRRTSDYVQLLARKTMEDGYYTDIITREYIDLLGEVAPLHDIGKIVVPDNILKKPGRLTPEEFCQMQLHTIEGGRIVKEVLGADQDKEYLQCAMEIATSHHEKWNGRGYPYQLEKEDIPLSARIMAIADVFDALVSPRCYKSPMPYYQAFNIIEEETGQSFDPILAQEFLKLKDFVMAINESYRLREK